VAGRARDASQREGKMGKGPGGAQARFPGSASAPRAQSGAGSLPRVVLTHVRAQQQGGSARADGVRRRTGLFARWAGWADCSGR
jgi:hypothetical protein